MPFVIFIDRFQMTRTKGWWAVPVVVLGVLQAWDSGVLRAGGTIQILVALAIAAPPLAMVLASEYGLQAMAIAGAFVLLTVARVMSPVSLPTLHLIAFIPAVVVFLTKATAAPAEGGSHGTL